MLSPEVRSGATLFAYTAWTSVVVCAYFVVPDASAMAPVSLALGGPYAAEASRAVLRAITGAGAVLLACYALGALAMSRISLPADDLLQRVSYRFALGFIALSLASQALAYAEIYTAATVRSLVLLLAVGGAVFVVRHSRDVPRITLRGHDLPLVVITAAAMLIACIGALAPESEYDALWYHLWLPRRWLEAGKPVDIIEEYVSLYPLSWDLAYGAALTVGGPGAAKLLHFACLPLLAIATWLLCREIAGRVNPWVAVALTVTTPTVLWEATTAYVDLALTWYVALSVFAAIRHCRSSTTPAGTTDSADQRWLGLAAVMLGGALAIKHLALIVALVIGATLLVAEMRRHAIGAAVRRLALFTVLSLAIPAPWYARAYVASGNPVFPDLYRLFGAAPSERWDAGTERGLARFKAKFGRERTPLNLVLLPWDVTVHGARYGGSMGPLFLILLPAGLIADRRAIVKVVLAGLSAYVLLWASPISSFQLRFLLPTVPLLAVIGAIGFDHIRRSAGLLSPMAARAAAATLVLMLAMNAPAFVEWHDRERHHGGPWLTHVIREVPLAVVTGAESRDAYLRRTVPSYAAWAFINDHVPVNARVLTFSGGDHLYSDRFRLWSDATLARPVVWGAEAGSELETMERLHEMGVTHVLIDELQTTNGSTAAIALTSPAMRSCCLREIYRDGRYSLHTLVSDGDGGER